MPPTEIAVHPSDENDKHELYLLCDDIDSFVVLMNKHNIPCEPVQDQGWDLLSALILPGGGNLFDLMVVEAVILKAFFI